MKNQIISYFSGNFEPFYRKYLLKIEKTGGGEWRAVCPFHEDTDPSLNFNETTGQYFCHGCGKKGDVFHFYGKINCLATKQDFGKILNGICSDFGISKPSQPRQKKTASYDYQDADGKPIFQMVRMEPGKNGKAKDFRQRRPGANGKWVWNLKGIEPVLYRLPEVIKADEVIICEGEKDCENLRTLGFTATTCPMGAGKWRDSYSQYLKGKRLVLIPDNDNPGREHMTRVAVAVNGTSAGMKMLTIDGLPSKGDVSDFIESVGNKIEAAEMLADMIKLCKPYTPPKKATLEDACLDIADFHRLEITTRKEYLSPWLKEDAIGLCSGWRGTGKTFFALGVIDAVTNGASFGPWDCQRAVPALFLDGEMPPADIQERSEILRLNKDRKQPLIIYSDCYANGLGLPRANLNSDTWRRAMKRILTTRGIKLWVIDNLASVAGGLDENSRQEWDPINQWLLELRFAGISTLMLHHTGKGGAQRGTSAREDNLDFSIILKSPPDFTPEDGARFICHFSKARVRASALNQIQDNEFKLTMDETGRHVWTCGGVRQAMEIEILSLLHDGMKQIDVANVLSVNRGQVSKVRGRAIKNELLNQQNKLLPKGYNFIKDGNI